MLPATVVKTAIELGMKRTGGREGRKVRREEGGEEGKEKRYKTRIYPFNPQGRSSCRYASVLDL